MGKDSWIFAEGKYSHASVDVFGTDLDLDTVSVFGGILWYFGGN